MSSRNQNTLPHLKTSFRPKNRKRQCWRIWAKSGCQERRWTNSERLAPWITLNHPIDMRPKMPPSQKATSEGCNFPSKQPMLPSQTSMAPTTRKWWKEEDRRKMLRVEKESNLLYQLISKYQRVSMRSVPVQTKELEVVRKWVNHAKMRCIKKQGVLPLWHLRLSLPLKRFLCVTQRIRRPGECDHRPRVKTWVRSVWSKSKSRRILLVLKFQWPATAPQRCLPIIDRPRLVPSLLMSSNLETWLEVFQAKSMLATSAPETPMTAWSHLSLSGPHNQHHVLSYPLERSQASNQSTPSQLSQHPMFNINTSVAITPLKWTTLSANLSPLRTC